MLSPREMDLRARADRCVAALAGERAPLVRAVLAAPADDAPRLIYADWLDEHGEPAEAFAWRERAARAAVLRDREADGPRLAYADLCDQYGHRIRAELIRRQLPLAGRWRYAMGVLDHQQLAYGTSRWVRELNRIDPEMAKAWHIDLTALEAINARAELPVTVGEARWVRGFVEDITVRPDDWIGTWQHLRGCFPLRVVRLYGPAAGGPRYENRRLYGPAGGGVRLRRYASWGDLAAAFEIHVREDELLLDRDQAIARALAGLEHQTRLPALLRHWWPDLEIAWD